MVIRTMKGWKKMNELYKLAYELNPGEIYFLRERPHMKSKAMRAIVNKRINEYFESYRV